MKRSRVFKRSFVFALVLMTSFGVTVAQAQTSANADAAYNGWLQAFLVKSATATYFANSLTDRSEAFMWGQAYMITGVEDAYDASRAAERKQLVSDLLDRFEIKNHADLSWDSWNDDIAWATIALIRGYQITGNATFLSAAKQAWDMAYKRGWDSTYGGGLWENMDNVPAGGKCGLSNWPFVISGALIYQSTHDMSYLSRSEAIYAWARANVFDTTTGRVHEQVGPAGVIGDDNAYNSGLIVNAASALYQITGTAQYSTDAALAAKHVMTKYAVMTEDHPANGDFGGDQFFRGLGNFARQNGPWSTYAAWLDDNAAAAWKNRRTDFNVSLNNFTKLTPATGNLDAMEAEGSVVVQLVIQDNAVTPTDGGSPSNSEGGDGSVRTDGGNGSSEGDASVRMDGGHGGSDASSLNVDAGSTSDTGSSTSSDGSDAAGSRVDGAGSTVGTAGGGGNETGTSSGCSCSESGSSSRAPLGLAFLVLSLVSIGRPQKRRDSSGRR